MIGALTKRNVPPHLARKESVGFWDRVLCDEPAMYVIPPEAVAKLGGEPWP